MAAKKFLVPVDLNQNEIQNVVIQNLATFPSSPVAGQVVFRTSDDIHYGWDGSTWHSLYGSSGSVVSVVAGDGITVDDTDPANPIVSNDGVITVTAGTNITVDDTDPQNIEISADIGVESVTAGDGSITIGGTSADPTVAVTAASLDHTYITDFDTQVRTSRLDQMAAPTASVNMNSQKITGLANGTNNGDAVNFGQLSSLSQGFDFKEPVRVVATTNGTLASAYENGDTVDGVTLVTGDRILLAGQTSAAENGIYTVNASGAPTRAVDADASGEIQPGTFVPIIAGTAHAGDVFYCSATGATPWVPGSSTSTWAQFPSLNDLVAGDGLTKTGDTIAVGEGTGIIVNADDVAIDTSVVVRKYSEAIGDGSSTDIVVTHSLGTKDITVSVRDTSSDQHVICDVESTSTSTATFSFAVAPTTDQYTVVIHG
jgi:hypothetical protein